MEKIALIADSTCDLPEELINKYNVNILPLKVIYTDREYTDRVDITPQYLYDNLKTEIPKTSLPSMKDMDDLFERLKKEGYTHAIAICISSGLSGTYNSLKLVSENHPEIISTIFDSKSISFGVVPTIVECGDLIAKGEKYDSIVSKLPSMQKKVSAYFMVDTLEYLKKGGRIGKVSGTIGELLHIKPIISINEEGIYYTYAKIRGKKQALSKFLSIIKDELDKQKCGLWVAHGGASEEGKNIYNTLSTYNNLTSIGFGEVGPVVGVHTGPGFIAISVKRED
ncbi:DegV family protein [Clostridium sp. MSJ-4]|uniref:DegV family protein n=1 Tax=Clostridium simiarum TaxID=2841506 RepID=A0ABS6F153_9CLOT|nr:MULTISPECIES: DegV family protein [Clostridium]MBU5592120.1 DegV family protein [Clostridium simiarum]